MTDAKKIHIPLINPNEPEALITDIYIKEGDKVSQGDPLCTLETTKSTQEVTAEYSGYVAGIRHQAGEIVQAGELFCFLALAPDWHPPEVSPKKPSQAKDIRIPDGLRITQPALALLKTNQLNLDELPQNTLITEAMIKEIIENSANVKYPSPSSEFDPTAIIIYGGGGHGKSLIDLLLILRKYRIVGIIDDGLEIGEEIMDVPVIGGGELLSDLYKKGIRTAVNAVGGIGYMGIRIEVFERISRANFICPTVIHPTAFIEASAILSAGIQVFPHAYIGSQSEIGYGVIVNTSVIISHDCKIGNYTNISPGAILAGEVKVGVGVLIGMGTTINLQVEIGDGARIGNGATIKSNVPENGIVRAGSIWPA